MSVISFYSIHVYTQAMESGYIKQQNTVAVVTVIMGAEKLTFPKWRFQQKISSSYTSTGVMGDSYQGIMITLWYVV